MSTAPAAKPERFVSRRALAVQLTASALILVALVVCIPHDELSVSLRGLHPGWLLAAVPLKLGLIVFHEVRLYLPLKPWPRATLRRVLALGFTAGVINIVVPMRGGDLLAISLLRQECGVPTSSATVAVGLAGALEALAFGLTLLVLLTVRGPALAAAHPPLALLAETGDLTWLLAALTVGVAVALLGLRALYRWRRDGGQAKPGLVAWLAEAGRGLGAGSLALNAILAGLQVVCVLGTSICIFRALGIETESPLVAAALVLAASSVLVTVLPQSFGAGPSAATIFVLGAFGVSSAQALAAAGLAWLLHVSLTLATGAQPTWHRLGLLGARLGRGGTTG